MISVRLLAGFHVLRTLVDNYTFFYLYASGRRPSECGENTTQAYECVG